MSYSFGNPESVSNPLAGNEGGAPHSGSVANVVKEWLHRTERSEATPVSRREFLSISGGLVALGGLPVAGAAASQSTSTPTFTSIAVSTADQVSVPPGYVAEVLYAWGDATGIDGKMPAFKPDGSNNAAEQAAQAGMHHDGMHLFALPNPTKGVANRYLLAINHEYTDDGVLHPGGMANWTHEKVGKAQAATGVSIIELEEARGQWRIVRPSGYARRVTANTPMAVSGPAAGHPAMRTTQDPTGSHVLGTLNNCAMGATPWGTYLTCEENFNGYFRKSKNLTANDKRYGINDRGFGFRWHEHDARFDLDQHPNEAHRFGWVVEIDPLDPNSTPVKRTALGRFKHEGASAVITKGGHLAVYMGDDERFEYIYKFVSTGKVNLRTRSSNASLLDSGTLYAAKFSADGRGQWLPLEAGTGALTPANGFHSQADVMIRTREAADAVGATPMDRPEWIALDPKNPGEVYCTLTNNTQRGSPGFSGPDAANPRVRNVYGHIIHWREAGGDAGATNFSWNVFALAGDDQATSAQDRPRTLKHSIAAGFGSPDGLVFDRRGLLWIQTDVFVSDLGNGAYARLGNNQMLCMNTVSGEVRRFLVGPKGSEVTGLAFSPDMRSMFVNIQHPGETPNLRSDPAAPAKVSSWPAGDGRSAPRSATVLVRRRDGGIIGT